MRARAPALLLLLTACGNASPPSEPSAAPAAAPPPTAAAAPKDESAERAAKIEALTSGEAKSGTCDPGSQAALDKLLVDIERSSGLTVVGKRVLALGAGAKSIEMSVSGKGTEVHVLAVGAKEISLDVLAGTGAATTMRSPLQHATPFLLDLPNIGEDHDVQSDSRQVQIKPGSPIVIKLSGQGCVGLITFVKP